jgi:hypothetical protein
LAENKKEQAPNSARGFFFFFEIDNSKEITASKKIILDAAKIKNWLQYLERRSNKTPATKERNFRGGFNLCSAPEIVSQIIKCITSWVNFLLAI